MGLPLKINMYFRISQQNVVQRRKDIPHYEYFTMQELGGRYQAERCSIRIIVQYISNNYLHKVQTHVRIKYLKQDFE